MKKISMCKIVEQTSKPQVQDVLSIDYEEFKLLKHLVSSTELIIWTIVIPTNFTYFSILCAIICEKAKDFLSQIIGFIM